MHSNITRAETVSRLRAHAQQVLATLDSVPVEMRVCRQCDAWGPGIRLYGYGVTGQYHLWPDSRYRRSKPPCPHCNGSGMVFIAKDKLYRYDGIQIG